MDTLWEYTMPVLLWSVLKSEVLMNKWSALFKQLISVRTWKEVKLQETVRPTRGSSCRELLPFSRRVSVFTCIISNQQSFSLLLAATQSQCLERNFKNMRKISSRTQERVENNNCHHKIFSKKYDNNKKIKHVFTIYTGGISLEKKNIY